MTMTNSNDNNGLATRPTLVPATMVEAFNLAKAASASRMFGMETAEQALMCLMRGMELGFGPATSLSAFHVIKGKPCLSTDAMVALCKSRKDLCKYFTIIASETNDDRATYETHRVGDPDPIRMSFTWQDAVNAGLTTLPGDMWKKYRKTMLRRRAASQLAKDVYPELLLGVYDPEEMESAAAQDNAAVQAVVTVVEEPRASTDVAPLGDPDPGYEAFARAKALLPQPITKDQAVQLWRDYAAADAPTPRVRPENGDRVMKEINLSCEPRFQSTHAFRNAVLHAEHMEAWDAYAAIVGDVGGCTTPDEIATAWMTNANALAEMPAEAVAFALAWCGSRVTACDGGAKQGTAWLKKRIAELGGTPPEKPTRGKDGANATGDHAPSANGSGEASASPEMAAAVASIDHAARWDAGEVTPETWRAHLAGYDVEQVVTNSHCKHAHRFGRDKEASVYRGVTVQRLREIGLSDLAAANAA